MKILLVEFFVSTYLSQNTPKEVIPFSSNYDCLYYQEAIEKSSSPFDPNFVVDSEKYYSQAP